MGVFWGKLWVAAGAPGAHRPPPHPFRLQDASDLAAADGDAFGPGGSGQGVKGPLRRLIGLLGPVQAQGAVGL